MLQLVLDPTSALPLSEQIVIGIRARIDDRVLRAGMRLPTIRDFAERHGVSRYTVVEAYDRLVALGYARSRRGSGFYVEGRPAPAAGTPARGELARIFASAGLLHRSMDESPNQLKVGLGWLPAEWYDEAGVRRHLRALSRQPRVKLTSYGSPQGYAPLREQLCVKLAEAEIPASPEQIVLTGGATHALDIIVRHLLKPGDCVFVDDPGPWNLFANLRLFGVNLIGVPRLPQGPDPAVLEALLGEHQPKMFFTQSVLQNPTACDLSPASAFRLLQLAEKHDFLVVEDDVYGDFHPRPPTRLASLDQLRRVIYVGSFSHTLSGNLRVGFVACEPELAASLTDVKIVTCLCSSEFAEQLVYRMLTEGHYRNYVQRLRERLLKTGARTLQMLERSGFTEFAEPAGGMFVWARAKGREDVAKLASQAAAEDIMLAPGHVFRPQLQPTPYLRFNVAYAQDPRLERFLSRAGGSAPAEV
ncbi:PLP-dependent aminotransferase family protein [Azoarcus sp. DN11]|uniref:aminotransferase-like domain-containing protein n=1 Tax=Azoarcus sp. DN11 TaxID=356837 RepID=UPI000EB093E1|nr:PLP-dependent aminotransferase family protein [Azoarcus sp. DN11]AYH44617.1 transcriptional regulator [Azoarcus sp. DN11]